MSMLHIERMESFSLTEWAIRFTGGRADFTTMIDDLKAEGWDYARWDNSAFDDLGGWVIDEATLLSSYSDRFDNLVLRMEHTKEREYTQVLADIQRVCDMALLQMDQEGRIQS